MDFALESVRGIHDKSYSDLNFNEEKFFSKLRHTFDFEPDAVKTIWLGEKRVGFLFIQTFPNEPVPYALVSQLYVEPQEREKGIGTAAMREAEKYARKNGLKVVRLDVALSNKKAVKLYEELGYEPEEMKMSKKLGSVK